MDERQEMVEWVARYRNARGLAPLGTVPSLRDALGEDVRVYRYRGKGRQFAIVKDPGARDALVAAGAAQVMPFVMHPGGPQCWDLGLPSYLWEFM